MAARTLPGSVVFAGAVRSSAALSVFGEVLLVVLPALAVGWWDWRVGLVVGLVVAAVLFRQVTTTGTSAVRVRLKVRTVDRRTGWPAGWAALVPGRTVTVGLGSGWDPVRTRPVAVPQVQALADPWGVGQPPPVLAVVVVSGGEPLELAGPTVVGTRPVASTPAGATAVMTDLSRTVSRSHLLLEPTGEGVWVTDLGSTNGTWVLAPGTAGGIEVPPRVPVFVQFGSVLALGVRQVRVLHPAQAAAAGVWSA